MTSNILNATYQRLLIHLKELITGFLFNEKQEEVVVFYPISYLSSWHYIQLFGTSIRQKLKKKFVRVDLFFLFQAV